jgi:hypothetical protein
MLQSLKSCYRSYRHHLANESCEDRPFIILALATELLVMACLLPAILLLPRGTLDASTDD